MGIVHDECVGHQARNRSEPVSAAAFRRIGSAFGRRHRLGEFLIGTVAPQASKGARRHDRGGRARASGCRAPGCLIGDGAMRPRIEALIHEKRLQDKVRLAGWRRDVPRPWPLRSVAVDVALGGLPRVMLEAASAGLPIVATQ